MGQNTTTIILYMAVIVAFLYLFMIRPGAKRMREQQATLSALQPGLRVMLASGIFGTVQAVGERQLVVELAPGVEVTALKQAVTKVLTADDEEFEYADDVDALDDAPLADDELANDPVASADLSAEPVVAGDPVGNELGGATSAVADDVAPEGVDSRPEDWTTPRTPREAN